MPFIDRAEAGRQLGARLRHVAEQELPGRDLVVLGLPRGGVPVAFEVTRSLRAPLDVVLVRKLGVPAQPELAMGAIGEDGVRILNPGVIAAARVTGEEIGRVESIERAELERRARRFRNGRPRAPVGGRCAVVVDDGLATGSTARAACRVARAHGATVIVLAVPVAPPGWTVRLGDAADRYIALDTPEPFFAIGQFYDDFSQTSDEEVVALLSAGSVGAVPTRIAGPLRVADLHLAEGPHLGPGSGRSSGP